MSTPEADDGLVHEAAPPAGNEIHLPGPSLQPLLLTLGITATLVLTAYLHIGVVIGLLPTTGLTLPFISWQGHIGGLLVGVLAGAAIGGLPTRAPHRLATRWQGVGLGGIAVLVVLVALAAQATRG